MGIFRFVRDLREYSKKNLIIVEGKNDKEVLKTLKIENVYTLYEIHKVDLSRFREALILVDRDRKGEILYRRVAEYLFAEGIIVNHVLRKKFFNNFRWIYSVEDLKPWVKRNFNLERFMLL